MSLIEIKSYPITHIIIRDFLDSSSKKKLLNSLLPIRDNHLVRLPSPARNSKPKEDEWDRLEKYRKGVMLHDILKDNSILNKDCIDILESNMGRDDLRKACRDTNDLLFLTHELSCVKGAMLFSQYEKDGHMVWHSDHGPVCSASYIFNFDGQNCAGGNFLLSGFSDDNLEENAVTYPFQDNFLILFPAKAFHRVSKVSGYRNSIQYFAGYEGWKVSDET